MKKIIIIASIVLTLILSGILYGTITRPEREAASTHEYYEYLAQFPEPMIDIPSYQPPIM